jgi:hypothetical protein
MPSNLSLLLPWRTAAPSALCPLLSEPQVSARDFCLVPQIQPSERIFEMQRILLSGSVKKNSVNYS